LALLDHEELVSLDAVDHREVDEGQDVLSGSFNYRVIRGCEELNEVLKVDQEGVEYKLRNRAFLVSIVLLDL